MLGAGPEMGWYDDLHIQSRCSAAKTLFGTMLSVKIMTIAGEMA